MSAYSASLIASKYWQTTDLKDMDQSQWEAICDGCAKCCLHKFIDDQEADEDPAQNAHTDHLKDDEEVVYTKIACQYLHTKKCECTQYAKRSVLVPQCVTLTKENLDAVFYMPPSCAYRRLQEGRGLPHWHPLRNNGKKNKMHALGMSARAKTVCETHVDLRDFEDFIVTWPQDDID